MTAMRALAFGTILPAMLFGCGHATLSSDTVPCAFTSFGASLTCVAVTGAAHAEAQLTFAPVDPSPIVRSATDLGLSSVILERLGLLPAGQPLPRAQYIVYVFGAVPSRGGGIVSIPVPARPRSLLVFESAPARSATRWHMGRVLGHLANGKPEYWPWNFWSASVNVEGNVPKRAIRSVGLWVLAHQSSSA